MTVQPELLLALDGVSALLALVMAAAFFRIWRTTRAPIHRLMALGLLLLGLSFAAAFASSLEGEDGREVWDEDEAQILTQLGSASVFLFTYLSSRSERRPEPLRVVGYSIGAVAVLVGILYVVVPPSRGLPETDRLFAIVDALTALAFGAVAAMSASGWGRDPRRERAFVPLAFLFLALGRYTLVLEAFGQDHGVFLIVYVWRFLGIGLLAGAVFLPRTRAEAPHGTA